ncbi:PREDICTED: MLO-like protein 13 isoform X2 [Nelumbo nucifera]|uniref:MLO-like protein n=1 Tax=Nelumbo nucifera TaxID=4432 RepID=A0A1U7Z4B1_NELNU|nr:PREDICTED: MLO-like protein 13 isoform X2 [Nelumbo nucifera]
MAESHSLEYTPTWVVAVVCAVIILISLSAERLLHRLGKFLKHKGQHALFEALEKLKEELMLLGFISLLLTVFEGLISNICISTDLASHMNPCKREEVSSSEQEIHNYKAFSLGIARKGRQLLAEDTNSNHCARMGKVPFLSLEGLHQLHIFIFVLAVVHVTFCATTMVLGGLKIQQWKPWEETCKSQKQKTEVRDKTVSAYNLHRLFVIKRAGGYWRKSIVISWIMSFFKQFYASVTKTDYIAMRSGFIKEHCPSHPGFNFHEYMMRTLEVDFKIVVTISWYLWLFVVIFLLLNEHGWHTFFWLSFSPLILLLLVGAKLEHIITRLAEDVEQRNKNDPTAPPVKPSDEHFWFGRPQIVLYLIHFILFENAFEIAFFAWIWCTFGFKSCMVEKLGYVIPRIIIGVAVQVLCSYSTLPLFAIVTQMGSAFKKGIFSHLEDDIVGWAATRRMTRRTSTVKSGGNTTDEREPSRTSTMKHGRNTMSEPSSNSIKMLPLSNEAFIKSHNVEQLEIELEEVMTCTMQHSHA